MGSWALFVVAVITVYIGGFVYDEVGPLMYAVAVALMASTPLLLQSTFWKKILLMLPLLVARVVGKILLRLFGKNALTRLLRRYGLLERRFNKLMQRIALWRTQVIARWRRFASPTRAYLVLIFLPVAVTVVLVGLIVRIVRLKFLQFLIEKAMQFGLEKLGGRFRTGPDSQSKS